MRTLAGYYLTDYIAYKQSPLSWSYICTMLDICIAPFSDLPRKCRLQLKKVPWRASFYVRTVKLAWVTSIGQVFSAVAEAGLPLLFNSIKAEWISAACEILRRKKVVAWKY